MATRNGVIVERPSILQINGEWIYTHFLLEKENLKAMSELLASASAD